MTYREAYERWLLSDAVDGDVKRELDELDEREIEDRFYRELSFGTGGLRGVMAAGSNRMNIYTVRQATEGVARALLDENAENSTRGVAIAYDSRNNSEKFAKESAAVLSAHGIRVYLFDRLCPTPELSFTVRHLGCAAGIVITASHNPKEYNGYKVYDEDGTQISPERAERILGFIRSVDIFEDVSHVANGDIITILGEEIHTAYIESIKRESLGIDIPDSLSVLYTPLHGSGNIPVRRILSEIGVKNLAVVGEQEAPDGDFPTVDSPNPENRSAFDIAIERAKHEHFDLILGTDPDSDRLGLVVPERDGSFTVLSGNETGALLADLILRKTSERGMPRSPRIVKTIVTTELVRKIASEYGVVTEDVLTGFKYIGDKIKEYERSGKSFLFGLEESYGYLKGTYARDKDAVVAAMLAVELAAECKAEGITLTERLDSLYKRYGYHKERLLSYTLKGIEGTERIKALMKHFRATDALPREVRRIDYSLGADGLPKSDVLKFILEDGWVAIRPSGTEPKIKVYIAVEAECANAAYDRIDAIASWIDGVITKE